MSNNCLHPTCFDSPSCRREKKEPKARKPIKRSPIKKAVYKAKPNKNELDEWFEAIAEIIAKNPRCMACNSWIHPDYYRHATAHILAKRPAAFPSVATHPSNWLILCVSEGCHQKFDRSYDDASKMAVWPLAIARIKQIYPSISPKELYRLPSVILEELAKDQPNPFL